MKEFVMSIITLAWKDILLELRTKDAITGVFMFAVLTAIIFNFAFAPSPTTAALVIPGVLWVSIVFAGVLGFNRSFVLEKDRGSIDGLLLCPVSRDVIYFGKVLGMFVFMTCVEIVLLPVFSVLYNVSLINIEIVLIIVLPLISQEKLPMGYLELKLLILSTMYFPILGSLQVMVLLLLFLLVIVLLTGRRVRRSDAMLLLVLYCAYVACQFWGLGGAMPTIQA